MVSFPARVVRSSKAPAARSAAESAAGLPKSAGAHSTAGAASLGDRGRRVKHRCAGLAKTGASFPSTQMAKVQGRGAAARRPPPCGSEVNSKSLWRCCGPARTLRQPAAMSFCVPLAGVRGNLPGDQEPRGTVLWTTLARPSAETAGMAGTQFLQVEQWVGGAARGLRKLAQTSGNSRVIRTTVMGGISLRWTLSSGNSEIPKIHFPPQDQWVTSRRVRYRKLPEITGNSDLLCGQQPLQTRRRKWRECRKFNFSRDNNGLARRRESGGNRRKLAGIRTGCVRGAFIAASLPQGRDGRDRDRHRLHLLAVEGNTRPPPERAGPRIVGYGF